MSEKQQYRVTKAMTPQDWNDIEERLNGFYDRVRLICDGYELSLVLQRYNQFRNVIHIYVNGVVEGKWYFEDCEERRRFFCPKTKNLLSSKEKAQLKKISKKAFREMEAKSKYTYYESHWSSFRALKNHLIKNNQSIKLVCKEVDATHGEAET